jgi:hypothetical protein
LLPLIKATDMLFFQVFLFFLFGIPAFATLFDPPPEAHSKGSSAYGPHGVHPLPYGPYEAISVVADNINIARGYWYRDLAQIREFMFVKGVGMGYEDGGETIIQLGEVKGIPDAEDLTMRPGSWKDLVARNIESITNGKPWRRYTRVSANLP